LFYCHLDFCSTYCHLDFCSTAILILFYCHLDFCSTAILILVLLSSLLLFYFNLNFCSTDILIFVSTAIFIFVLTPRLSKTDLQKFVRTVPRSRNNHAQRGKGHLRGYMIPISLEGRLKTLLPRYVTVGYGDEIGPKLLDLQLFRKRLF
jgi:hypothetical protein